MATSYTYQIHNFYWPTTIPSSSIPPLNIYNDQGTLLGPTNPGDFLDLTDIITLPVNIVAKFDTSNVTDSDLKKRLDLTTWGFTIDIDAATAITLDGITVDNVTLTYNLSTVANYKSISAGTNSIGYGIPPCPTNDVYISYNIGGTSGNSTGTDSIITYNLPIICDSIIIPTCPTCPTVWYKDIWTWVTIVVIAILAFLLGIGVYYGIEKASQKKIV